MGGGSRGDLKSKLLLHSPYLLPPPPQHTNNHTISKLQSAPVTLQESEIGFSFRLKQAIIFQDILEISCPLPPGYREVARHKPECGLLDSLHFI